MAAGVNPDYTSNQSGMEYPAHIIIAHPSAWLHRKLGITHPSLSCHHPVTRFAYRHGTALALPATPGKACSPTIPKLVETVQGVVADTLKMTVVGCSFLVTIHGAVPVENDSLEGCLRPKFDMGNPA